MVLRAAPRRLHIAKSADAILAAADRAEPAIRRRMLEALEQVEQAVPNLEALIEAGNTQAVFAALEGITLPDSLKRALVDATVTAAVNVGVPEAAQFGVRFNDVNVRAVRWAEANVGRQITGEIARDTIRDMIVRGLQSGASPRTLSNTISAVTPLLPNHQAAVQRLFQSILDAGGSETYAAKMAARKASKLKRFRATMIARTESVRAANMGQQLAWDSAADAGLLRPTARKVWLATGDDRTCPICAVMDGKTIGLSDDFIVNEQATRFARSGDTFRVLETRPMRNPSAPRTPPAHPQCRCTIVLEPGSIRPAVQPAAVPTPREPIGPHMADGEVPSYALPRPTPTTLAIKDEVAEVLTAEQTAKVQEAFQLVQRRWPGAVSEVSYVTTNPTATSLATKSRWSLNLNTEHLPNITSIREQFRSGSSRIPMQAGRLDDDLDYFHDILVHELGHVADARFQRVASPAQRDEWGSVWETFLKIARQESDVNAKDFLPSVYAGESPGEMAGEAILDYLVNPEPRGASKILGGLLDDVFGV